MSICAEAAIQFCIDKRRAVDADLSGPWGCEDECTDDLSDGFCSRAGAAACGTAGGATAADGAGAGAAAIDGAAGSGMIAVDGTAIGAATFADEVSSACGAACSESGTIDASAAGAFAFAIGALWAS